MTIHNGIHNVTKSLRVVAECDATDCQASEYLPNDAGTYHGSFLMREIGWEVADVPTGTSQGALVYPALCPRHATRTARCEHPHNSRRWLDGVQICGMCGRKPEVPLIISSEQTMIRLGRFYGQFRHTNNSSNGIEP